MYPEYGDRLLTIMELLFVLFTIISQHHLEIVHANSSLPHEDQLACKGLRPIEMSKFFVDEVLNSNTWITIMVTKRDESHPDDSQMTNICSNFSFTEPCIAVRTTYNFKKYFDRNGTSTTHAYNKDTNNIVAYVERHYQTDPKYGVFNAEIVGMGYFDEEKNYKRLDKIDPAANAKRDKLQYALLYVDDGASLLIFQDCNVDNNNKVVWVQMSEEALMRNLRFAYTAEINNALLNHKINDEELISTDYKFKFPDLDYKKVENVFDDEAPWVALPPELPNMIIL